MNKTKDSRISSSVGSYLNWQAAAEALVAQLDYAAVTIHQTTLNRIPDELPC